MTSIGWLQIVIEIATVFLGVSLSFWVADIREQRSEKRTARKVLLGIQSDLAAELTAIKWLIDLYGPSAEAARELYAQWRKLPEIVKKAEDTFYFLHIGAPFSPARANYETAKSLGTLGLIADDGLRNSMAAVFEQQHSYLGEISRFSAKFDFEFSRQLRPYIEYGASKHVIATYVIPGEAATPMSVVLLPDAAEKLSRDDIARNSMHASLLFRGLFAGLLMSHSQTLRDLDSSIQKYLDS